ncbi:MAG: hypothetical protein ACLFTT_14505 [Candidatus Hydrogenedentota bacterium]
MPAIESPETPPAAGSVARAGLEVFTISLTLMAFEINLVRLFSIVIRNVSFFVLAIALFGFGLGGLYAQIMGRGLRGMAGVGGAQWRFYLPLAAAAAMMVALYALANTPVGRPGGQAAAVPLWLSIGVLFLTTSLPFAFGSMYMARVFAERPLAAPRLYFSDLLGAGMACLLAVPLFEVVGGFAMPFVAAAIMLAPAAFVYRGYRRALVPAGLMVLLVLFGVFNRQGSFMHVTPEGDLRDRGLLFSSWNFFSWITVEPDPAFTGWRVSENYEGPKPDYLVLRQDGHAPAWILDHKHDPVNLEHLRYDITALPFRIMHGLDHALVIGAGGGRDILTAKVYEVPRVTGVELNPITANEVMRGAMRERSGNVYGMDGVDVVVENGRTFVERTQDRYDLVYTSLADTLLGNSEGIFVLSENHLYTAEAFSAYMDRLQPGGMACILYTALTQGHLLPRFLNTGIEALAEHGVTDPARHILAIMTYDPPGPVDEGICLMFSPEPIAPARIERAKASCEALGFSLAWPPAGDDNPWTEQVAQVLDAEARETLMAESFFDLTPLRDDRPYLFYMTKPSQFLDMLLNPWATAARIPAGLERLPFLIDAFFVIFVLVLVLMVSPLVIYRRSELAGGRPEQLLFLGLFFLLGISFMLIEVGLLQKLFLYLGNPTLTFAVTLGAMLLFTGLGSFLSRNFAGDRLWPRLLIAGCVALVMQGAVYLALPPLLGATMAAPLPVRIVLSFSFLAVLALPMGMLFPTCMRLLGWLRIDMVSWSWGMNGVGSVLGSVGASMLALNLGISRVMVAGMGCYALFLVLAALGWRVTRNHAIAIAHKAGP